METIHHRRINKKFRGFTLVELIVVITILVILGTIGFMSISGYSLSARDSTRISDMVNIKKSLELTSIKTSSYPTPTGGSGVTFSGGIVWTQGTIGDSVVTQVNAAGFRLSKKPMDPKYTSVEYTYSLLNNGKEYQVATTMEDSSTALNYPIITPVYAADPLTAYIGGNYNGLIAKVSTGTTTVTTYYLTLPSIVLQDLSSTELTNQNTQSGNLVLHKKGNIPSSYRGSGIVPSSPGITFDGLKNSNLLSSGTGIVAYSTTGSLGSSGVTVMMSNLYNLYNGSNLKGDNVSACSVSSLMSGGSGSTVLVNMYNGSLGKSLGGGVVDSGGGGGGGSALVNGACTGLLSTGAIYYNSGTSYNLSNAPIGTSLVASYTGGMISSNTCQFNCSSAYSWSGATSSCILRGEVVYATGGTYNWTVPAGVTSVSVVCVGGGANGGGVGGGGGGSLVYQNNIIVTSGQAFNFTVGAGGTSSAPLGQDSWIGGTAQAQGGRPGNMSGGVGGQYLGGNGGGNGGNGKFGGGGAGGYAGNGGNAATGDYGSGLSGSRGGGGGGGGSSGANFGGGGGGVGLLGEGVSGDGGGSGGAHGGKGGSGGENGNLSGGQNGGKYGGGGGWGAGGDGACRIIWPGTTRTFPSTDVGP